MITKDPQDNHRGGILSKKLCRDCVSNELMKKYVILFIIINLFLLSNAIAENRTRIYSMKDLTDPSSPSYVPYPYPQNRNEIIADLKYAIHKLFDQTHEGKQEIILGPPPIGNEIMLNLLEKKPIYKIGRIVKVKNLNTRGISGFSWLTVK
jgi:hypothetical protein